MPLGLHTAMILAGGRGQRLQAKVPHLPKPMAPVGGRPFLEYILDRLVDTGVTDVILSVGYRAEMIQEYFRNSYRRIPLQYSRETCSLGTGGAIVLGLKKADSSPILVLNGDTLVQTDYRTFVAWSETIASPVGVVLCQVPSVSRYGSVVLSGDRVVEFKEKGGNGPGLVNAGIYVIQHDVFSRYELGESFSFETDFLQRYCSELQLQAFIVNGDFIDIGTPEDYEKAQKEIAVLRVP